MKSFLTTCYVSTFVFDRSLNGLEVLSSRKINRIVTVKLVGQHGLLVSNRETFAVIKQGFSSLKLLFTSCT